MPEIQRFNKHVEEKCMTEGEKLEFCTNWLRKLKYRIKILDGDDVEVGKWT